MSKNKLNNQNQNYITGLYDLEKTIGQGHFAIVKSARHIFSGERVAIKIIDKLKLDHVSREHLFQEVKCMKLVQHPNVVRLYEVIDTPSKLYLVLEFGDGGDMYDYIMKHSNGLTESRARVYFCQIVKAIKYCHDLRVVHRDLKPENVVFFQQTGQVKLTDFGFSNIYEPNNKLLTSCGSLAYSAPEILLGDSYYAPPVDIWSLGVILYMLVTGRAPFQEASDSETLTMILDCKYYLPDYLSNECSDLISRMIVRDPSKRISLEEIYKHEWLNKPKLLNKNNNNSNSMMSSNDEFSDLEVDYLTTTSNASLKRTNLVDTTEIPLVKRELISKKDNDEIIKQMIDGDIATIEEIQEALDKDNYNYITATYYLLAERKLKKEYLMNKKKRIRTNANSLTTSNQNSTNTSSSSASNTVVNNNVVNNNKNNKVLTEIAQNQKQAQTQNLPNTNSSILSKNQFNSHILKMQQRNMLLRQDQAREEDEDELAEGLEEEEEEEEVNKKIRVNKALEEIIDDDEEEEDDDDEEDEELKRISEEAINENDLDDFNSTNKIVNLSTSGVNTTTTTTVTHLTNIIEDEDEEELQENEETELKNTTTNNLGVENVDDEDKKTPVTNSNSISSTNTSSSLAPTVITTIRRSSRGAILSQACDNLISKLTIPEEDIDDDDLNNDQHKHENGDDGEDSNKNLNNNNNNNEDNNNNNILNHQRQLSPSLIKSLRDEAYSKLKTTKQGEHVLIKTQNSSLDDNNVEEISLSNNIKSKRSSFKSYSHDPNQTTENNQQINDSLSNINTLTTSSNNKSKYRNTSRVSSSGAETSDSENELMNKNKQDLIAVKDHDWNRSVSTSSRSRNKLRSNQFNRPLSVSSETTNSKDELGVTLNTPNHVNQNNQTVVISPNSKTLSVEHRMANMSQMSISSQLSKNNSFRYHRSTLTGTETPNQLYNQQISSTTPTPRESIVFNRGDEKPFAKILLQHQQQQQQQQYQSIRSNQSVDLTPNSIVDHPKSKSFDLSTDESKLAKLNNSLIQSKIESFNATLLANNSNPQSSSSNTNASLVRQNNDSYSKAIKHSASLSNSSNSNGNGKKNDLQLNGSLPIDNESTTNVDNKNSELNKTSVQTNRLNMNVNLNQKFSTEYDMVYDDEKDVKEVEQKDKENNLTNKANSNPNNNNASTVSVNSNGKNKIKLTKQHSNTNINANTNTKFLTKTKTNKNSALSSSNCSKCCTLL